ncbi:hypothetical protein [Polymorphobacter fuscus]|uniref:Uncharacterized protein n=1 Tax=Sandarakinorhabdus fusca TaxID=1439888 RepID=A0A7C9KX76_9SPHN|nr:hypothetical protein [Polymorphobacter fuscus]KAB7646392.1 hypothetical protein F9290_10160 [Polymorphobacter fuscus]MQT17625.1 hypothetical protein [Polymorphobacter fuscus]NJC09832.1 hypothetical protein [Polymorphobacter fuscus]
MVWTSLFGIVTLVLLARALGFGASPLLADDGDARRIAADAIHGFAPADAVVARDGRGALVAGQDGRVALVRPLGDRWVVRIVNGAAAAVTDGRLRVTPAETMFPPADLDLGPAAAAWAQRL